MNCLKKKKLEESYAAETSVAAEPKIFTLVFYRKSLPSLVLETSVFPVSSAWLLEGSLVFAFLSWGSLE